MAQLAKGEAAGAGATAASAVDALVRFAEEYFAEDVRANKVPTDRVRMWQMSQDVPVGSGYAGEYGAGNVLGCVCGHRLGFRLEIAFAIVLMGNVRRMAEKGGGE